MWLYDLALAGDRCGGKAARLARLVAAGLPVPPGFAIDGDAFAQIAQLGEPTPESAGHALADAGHALADAGHALADAAERIARADVPDFVRELAARAAALAAQATARGARLIVRSSASFEDAASGAGAGVLDSIRDVAPSDVWPAVRAVWTSALAPIAVAYARRHASAIRVGAIVQVQAPGTLVTVYTRPPGAPTGGELLIQRGEQLAREPREPREPREAATELGALALRAEAAIAATGGADVELIVDEATGGEPAIAVVQARPIVHPPPRAARQAPPPIVLAPLDDGRTWTWDVAHNPDPLSPAQAGLAERVAQLGAHELRVCAGYLYTSPRPGIAPPAIADLCAQAAALTAKLDTALAAPAGSLDATLDRYAACYAIWANELSPLVAAARAGAATAAQRASSVEVTLARAARGELTFDDVIDRIGDLAPAWDVAVMSFRETPSIVRDAIAAADASAAIAREPAAPREPAAAADPAAAFVADLAERDDLYFARMQQLVRRALLARAAELGLAGDDIFWLSLERACAGIDPVAAHRLAAAARAAHARAAAWDMPVVVGGAPRPAGIALHGVGSGPRVVGRTLRFATLAGATLAGPGDVVVVRAVTPALAMFVGKCAAIVSETGGLLDHGAALARELGIPFVVGCHDAWHVLTDGTLVTVDGDRGVVY